MALSDPQSITIGGNTTSLPRTGSGIGTGIFTAADDTIEISILHSTGRRNRNSIRVRLTKIAADPLISAQNIIYTTTAVLTIDKPKTGFTQTELKDFVLGFFANLTASTNANLIKFLGGEA